MSNLSELLDASPVVPFIRESDYAIRKPWCAPIRRLLDYLLIYVQEGEMLVEADGVQYQFVSGEFCLLQPNTVQSLIGTSNTITPFAHFDIFYNPERHDSFPTLAGQIDLTAYAHLMQPRLDDVLGIGVPVKLEPKRPLQFRDTMLDMVECWGHKDPIRQLKAQHLATALVLSILEDFAPSSAKTGPSTPSFNWITSFFHFNLSEPLSIADMALRANLSPSRFCTLFKLQFGTTPHRYLMELRVNHACALLQNSTLSLEEIASYCGFADIHHFSKTFKKKTGLPPGAYRKTKQT
ncbi:AraC family transcriptional regulator [Paenibacillus sp. J2TS4]|uniref:helix-turn-helix domain-containing protein n=1 Tax=Paenibacillus sp. J2TS4 TaxID=2807194 RepID=UPI001B2ACA63|nr:AraC family transcriptional regulator [Paenibacillus sp. J2TS4]GIP34970.1 hypothetical protein J2TS4_41800 [Paenibacillus sp. J2TS4]